MTVDSSATTGLLRSSAPATSSLSLRCILANQFADAAQSRAGEAAERAAVRGAAVTRPIYEHRPADDQLTRNKTPIATVLTVVAAIAHDKEAIHWHQHRFSGNAEF